MWALADVSKISLVYMWVTTASLFIEEAADIPPPAHFAPWMEETEDYLEQLKNHRARSARKRRLSENPSGNAYYGSRHDLTIAHAASLSKKARLDIHAHLAKAESALATQNRYREDRFRALSTSTAAFQQMTSLGMVYTE